MNRVFISPPQKKKKVQKCNSSNKDLLEMGRPEGVHRVGMQYC